MASTVKIEAALLAEDLETLLEFTSPSSLRQTITFLYFSHVMEPKNLEGLPLDFHQMSAEVFVLIEFLEKVEEKIVDSGQKKKSGSVSKTGFDLTIGIGY